MLLKHQTPHRRRSSMKARVLFAALCLSAMLLAQGPVKATEMVLNENSPTDLTVTLSGTTVTVSNVTNTAPDAWTVTLSGVLIPSGSGFASGLWTDPENSKLFNSAQLGIESTSM